MRSIGASAQTAEFTGIATTTCTTRAARLEIAHVATQGESCEVALMTKQLSLAAALVFAVACKTDAPSPGSAAPAGEAATKTRSAKIAVKPAPPALPAAPGDRPSADAPPRDPPIGGEEWRERRKARLDTDGDGVISDEERAAAMHERLANVHARFDTDADGKLTPAELANARGPMRFDDPAALDTNHDGDISADELAAAFKARREQWRGSGSGAQVPRSSDTR